MDGGSKTVVKVNEVISVKSMEYHTVTEHLHNHSVLLSTNNSTSTAFVVHHVPKRE